MDYMKELMRIADKLDSKEDANIVRAAAVKLAPMSEPKSDDIEKIPGWGYVRNTLY